MTKDGAEQSPTPNGAAPAKPGSAVDALLGQAAAPLPKPAVAAKPTTEHENLEKARIVGTRRDDLSGPVTLGGGLGEWTITVITTSQRLDDGSGHGPVPARQGTIVGKALEVLVWEEHPIFREYGRDVRDAALMRVAELIKGLAQSDLSIAAIYAELVQAIDDLKTTDVVIVERIRRAFDRVRDLMFPVVAAAPEDFWELLTAADKTAVENRSAVGLPSVGLKELVEDGRFIRFVSADALRRMIEDRADAFFDGRVFKPRWAGRNEEARARIVGYVVRDLASLDDFEQDPLMRHKQDIAFALISLDHLESQLSSEEHG